MSDYKITEDQVEQWGSSIFSNHALTWFAQVLNGEYDVAEAREDCLSSVDPEQCKKEREDGS